MMMPDVNVVLGALRPTAPVHEISRRWLEVALAGREPIAMSELVLSATVRLLTNTRVFSPPDTSADAVSLIHTLRTHRNAVLVRPGTRHWDIFASLCVESDAAGNMVSDAYHAALAIEHGCEWITHDRDFARFSGLRWRVPS
jgi:uncharacterized protein